MSYGPEPSGGDPHGDSSGDSYDGPATEAPPRSRRPLWWTLVVLGALVIIILVGVYSCSSTRTTTYTPPSSPIYPPVVDGTPPPPYYSTTVVPPTTTTPTTATPSTTPAHPPTRVEAGTGGERATVGRAGAVEPVVIGLVGLVMVGAGAMAFRPRRRRGP